MRTLSKGQCFFLGFLVLTLGTFLPACTSMPKDTRPQVYIASDGLAYTVGKRGLVEPVSIIPEGAIVTSYQPYYARLDKDKK